MNGWEFAQHVIGTLALVWFLGLLTTDDPAWPRRFWQGGKK